MTRKVQQTPAYNSAIPNGLNYTGPRRQHATHRNKCFVNAAERFLAQCNTAVDEGCQCR